MNGEWTRSSERSYSIEDELLEVVTARSGASPCRRGQRRSFYAIIVPVATEHGLRKEGQ